MTVLALADSEGLRLVRKRLIMLAVLLPLGAAVTWYALSGPAGLSDDVVQKLNQAVNAAWATPAVKRRLADDAIVAEPMSPQAVTEFVTREVRKWGPIARRVMTSP